MCLCKDNHWARVWNSPEGLPNSEHAKGCDEYEEKKYLTLRAEREEGAYLIIDPSEIMQYLEGPDDSYFVGTIKLTEDQFKNLPEFEGF